jgi:hypothetical protein
MTGGQDARFSTPKSFVAAALITDASEHEVAAGDPEGWRAGQVEAEPKVAERGDAEE